MFGDFLIALAIWAVILGLLYVGIMSLGPQKKNKQGKESTSTFIRIVRVIAWPVTAVFVLIGAALMAKDIEDFFKK